MLNRENKLDYYLKIGLITLFVGFFLTHLSAKMAIRTEFTFFTLDVYHAIMMKIEPTDIQPLIIPIFIKKIIK